MNENMSLFINNWLGTISHWQMVLACYVITLIVLIIAITSTYVSGKNLKKRVNALEKTKQARKHHHKAANDDK